MPTDRENAQETLEPNCVPTNQSEQVWNALFKTASELADYADEPPLVLITFEQVREKAASIVHELLSHRSPLPTMPMPHNVPEEHADNDTVSTEFKGVAQSLVDRLLELVANAIEIATTNSSATDDYWRSADLPQADLEGTLECLCVALEPLGINVPGSEERRIRKAAWELVCNLNKFQRSGGGQADASVHLRDYLLPNDRLKIAFRCSETLPNC